MVSCLCPYRHRLVKAVRLDVLAFVVSAVAAEVEHAAVPQAVPREAAVAHVAQVATSPDPVLYEPAAAVVVVELRRLAALAVPVAAVVVVPVAVEPQHVHRAAAVALAAPDVQLSLH